jgi:hypothetical protein
MHQSQFYTVADTIRRICKDADAQAFLVCDELNAQTSLKDFTCTHSSDGADISK